MNSKQNVIFGTGPLGLSVMDALAAKGEPVTLVNRSGKVAEALPGEVEVVKGDATDPASVAAITQGAAVVYHCAQPNYHQWPELFPPITQGILGGVTRSGARLIFGDNLYMYGPTDGQPIHEGLPYAATGRKGRTRAAMAQILLEAHRAGDVRVAIGRASDFYGPRVTGSTLGEMVFAAALAGKPVNLLGNLDLPHTYTYISDFGRALALLGERDEALGRAWHVSNAPTLTTRQIIELIGQEVGQPIKTRAAGRFLITMLGLFNPTIREFKEMIYEFEEPYRVDHSQFAQTFGDLSTPHPEAIRATVAWYRQHYQAHRSPQPAHA